MPLDPQFEPFILSAPLATLPLADSRELMRQASAAMPKREIRSVVDQTIPGPAGDLPIRLYYPDRDGPVPMLVFIHGGGWTFGDLETHDHVCRSLCDSVGAVVGAIEYRLAPENKFPAAADDCEAALGWFLDNCAALGCDPAKFIIAGDSAGGNLAALTTQRMRDRQGPGIAFQVLMYPATDFSLTRDSFKRHADAPGLKTEDVVWAKDNYLRDSSDAVSADAAPHLCAEMTGLPPAFILTAEIDPLCDDGEDYARKLVEAGVPVLARRYLGAPHGFLSASEDLAPVREAFEDIARAIRWALR